MIRVLDSALVVSIALSTCAKLHAQRRTTSNGHEIVDVVAAGLRGSSAADKAFRGYAVPREFAICDSAGLMAIALKTIPPAWLGPVVAERPVSNESASAFLFSVRPQDLPPRCFTLKYQIGNSEVVAFPLIDSVYSAVGTAFATLTALYHEAFHVYQRNHFTPTRNVPSFHPLEEPPAIPKEIVESEAFNQGAHRERELLAAAIATSKRDSLILVIRSYLRARANRMLLAPADLRWGEVHNERKEGSAHYVGYKAALLALGSDKSLDDLIRSDLMHAPQFRNGRGYRNWHIYASGAAIGLLLDHLGVNWQERVQGGASLLDLLDATVAWIPMEGNPGAVTTHIDSVANVPAGMLHLIR